MDWDDYMADDLLEDDLSDLFDEDGGLTAEAEDELAMYDSMGYFV